MSGTASANPTVAPGDATAVQDLRQPSDPHDLRKPSLQGAINLLKNLHLPGHAAVKEAEGLCVWGLCGGCEGSTGDAQLDTDQERHPVPSVAIRVPQPLPNHQL